MKKYYCLLFLIFTSAILPIKNAFASEDDFPWELFIPVFSQGKRCSPSTLDNCASISACKDIGRYWYSNQCNEVPYAGSDKIFIMESSNLTTYSVGHSINYSGSVNGNFQTYYEYYGIDYCADNPMTGEGTGKTFVSISPYSNENLPPLKYQTTTLNMGSFSSSAGMGFSQESNGTITMHYTDDEDYYHNFPVGVLYIKSPLTVGQTWSNNYELGGMFSTRYKSTYTVVGKTNAETSIGTFEAYKIQYSYEKQYLYWFYKENGYIWIYPNIGVIKGDITVNENYNTNYQCRNTYALQYEITGSNLFNNHLPMN